MSEKSLCPRLADYIVIVGSRSPNHQTSIQPPELLRRYPTEDHKVSTSQCNLFIKLSYMSTMHNCCYENKDNNEFHFVPRTLQGFPFAS